ncbi:MAG: hypothetical protein C0390_05525 [Syntrophus sp. (in: bacteria)]|nr:hypothetical protein [Syntrophus sp. (in: bacteria)]
MADQEMMSPAACGYGLLGLCCVSCLKGPCRISPFDDAGSAGLCGEDRDWIVAHNIVQRVALESLPAMAAFRNALERASLPGSRIETQRLDEMKDLLSPFSRKENASLGRLYPEKAFPSLHAMGYPSGSWIAVLLDTITEHPSMTRSAEANLVDALRLSAMALGAEALSREISSSTTGEMDVALPDSPFPLLLLISDESAVPDDSRESLLDEIEASCRDEVRTYRLPHAALLPSFARRVFDQWGAPVSMTKSIAVVASSSITWGLGALALGFSLISLPGYPIQGSLLVENYLTEVLKRKFGHAYLFIPPREDLCDRILGSLKP